MPDYTPLGIEKIIHQAKNDLTMIRCPRDSAVMRVLAYKTADWSGRDQAGQNAGLPVRRNRVVIGIDVECPACRRRAMQVALAGDEVSNATPPSPNGDQLVVPVVRPSLRGRQVSRGTVHSQAGRRSHAEV